MGRTPLLLLYAQDLGAISRLTTNHGHVDGEQVSLQLGDIPVVLSEPLAALVLDGRRRLAARLLRRLDGLRRRRQPPR